MGTKLAEALIQNIFLLRSVLPTVVASNQAHGMRATLNQANTA